MNKNKCFECEAEGVAIHQHHVVPRSRGGTKTVPLCEPCHSKAHHRKKNMNTSALVKESIRRRRAKGEVIGRKDFGEKEGRNGVLAYKNKIDKHNETIISRIKSLKEAGITGYTAIARHLNSAGFTSVNGKIFYPQSIRNIIMTYGIQSNNITITSLSLGNHLDNERQLWKNYSRGVNALGRLSSMISPTQTYFSEVEGNGGRGVSL